MQLRNQTFTVLGQTSKQIAGPNMRRKKILISSPPTLINPETNTGASAFHVDTSVGGIKVTYTVPAGVQATLQSATVGETTGTTVVSALQLVRGGNTLLLASFTGSGSFGAATPLQAGDVVQWNVTTAVALSFCDYTLNVVQDAANARITISFSGDAVLDQGITINPGQLPLDLSSEMYGEAIREPIFAIAASGSPTIGVLDIFGP